MSVAYNDDILTEILLRLPAKSLIRFKLVCKKLLHLISSEQFSFLHYVRHHLTKLEPSLLLFLRDKSEYFYLQAPSLYAPKLIQYHFPHPLVDPIVLGFSNGFFLLRCRDVDNEPERCFVYNPTTKQFKRIQPNVNERMRTVMGLNLACDPFKPTHYKIICVRAGGRRPYLWLSQLRRCQIEVYESETGTWKLCGDPFWAPNYIDFNRGVCWNGGIHWTGIFFDFNENVVGAHPSISVPGNPTIDCFDGNYIESNGHLHYIAHVKESNSVAVLELLSDYSTWCFKYRVDLGKELEPLSVLNIYRGDKEEEDMILLHQPGKVFAYRFHDKRFKELVDLSNEGVFKEGFIQFVSSFAFRFNESLAPVT